MRWHVKAGMALLKEVKANNVNFKIEYFLGGDWKFLACRWFWGSQPGLCLYVVQLSKKPKA